MRKRERIIIEGDFRKGLKIPSLREKRREGPRDPPGLSRKVRSMMSTEITKPLGSHFFSSWFILPRFSRLKFSLSLSFTRFPPLFFVKRTKHPVHHDGWIRSRRQRERPTSIDEK